MFQQPGLAVVIFRRNDHKAVGAFADCREFGILDLLAGIVNWNLQIANINQFSFNAFAFLDFTEDEFRNVLTGAPSAHCAENYRDEKWSSVHGHSVIELATRHKILFASCAFLWLFFD